MIKAFTHYGIIRRLFLLFVLAFSTSSIFSQQDLTLHLMPVIPQSNYTNPAFKPLPRIYVGFPAFSSLYLGIGNSGFTYKNLIQKRSDDSLEIAMDEVLDKMGKTNYLSMNFTEEFLTFGIRIKKNFFNFSINEKISFCFSYPKELISLLWNGNGQYVGKSVDINGTGINATHYREYALGYSRDINDKIVVGTKIKYLWGLANVFTERNSINLEIKDSDFENIINTDFLINTSLPESVYDDSTSTENENFDFGKYIMNSKNTGLGIDLGAMYKYNDKFSFGASILDLGYIKWKTGVRNFSNNVESFSFEGIDLNQFFSKNDSDANDKFDKLLDSISDIFKITKTKNSYKTSLTTKIYLTGIYSLTPNDRVGLLIRNEFFNKALHPSLTASYNRRFGNYFNASVSYSVQNRSFTNLGLGLALNLGCFQTYFVSDNIISIFAPVRAKNINLFHFGFNFIFGYKDKGPNSSSFKN